MIRGAKILRAGAATTDFLSRQGVLLFTRDWLLSHANGVDLIDKTVEPERVVGTTTNARWEEDFLVVDIIEPGDSENAP